ncbi:MAG: hypothetical protein E7148_01845 [Rikenellaceae bacterium]|nr:hypothetical protein [Rikenellaceae bacterium]
MKKLLFLIAFIMLTTCVTAQTQIAYCDIYARGGGQNLRVTFMFNNTPIHWQGYTNLGEILNFMSKDGWTLDKEIVINNNNKSLIATRHKLHLIMKKEYQEGENPFSSLQHIKNETSYISNTTNHTNSTTNYNKTHYTRKPKSTNSTHKYKVWDNINYNGVSGVVGYITGHQLILVAKEFTKGTWDEAVKYCDKLGNGWKLPTVEESKKIAPQMISNNNYWTIEEVNEKKAKIFRSHYGLSANKNKINTILPIAIVNPNDLK